MEEAVEAGARAAALAPDDAVVHLFRGRILYDAGRFDEAEESFHAALKLGPHNELAQAYLPLCRWASGKDRAALASLDLNDIPESPSFLARLLAAMEREFSPWFRPRALGVPPGGVTALRFHTRPPRAALAVVAPCARTVSFRPRRRRP